MNFRGIITTTAAAAHILTVGVNHLFAVVIINGTVIIIFIVLIEIEDRRSGDGFPEMPSKVEIFTGISEMMLIAGLLIIETFVHGCSSSDPAKTTLGDTPGPT